MTTSQSPERGFRLSRTKTIKIKGTKPSSLNPLSGASGFHGGGFEHLFGELVHGLNPLSGASGFHGANRIL